MPDAPSSHPLIALAVTLGAATCATEPLPPRTLGGTYDLNSVGGEAPPAVYASSADWSAAVVQGSLRFVEGNRVIWTWRESLRYAPGVPYRDTTYMWTSTLPYTLQGARLTIGHECPPDPRANCAAPTPGVVLGSTLVLKPGFSRADWTFVRVDP